MLAKRNDSLTYLLTECQTIAIVFSFPNSKEILSYFESRKRNFGGKSAVRTRMRSL